MGNTFCKGDKIDDEKLAIHKAIEADIRLDKKRERKRLKILLLGSADSGKSTLNKQMRIIHNNGFNETEALNYSFMIKQNVIDSLHHHALAIKKFDFDIPGQENELYQDFLKNHSALGDADDDEQKQKVDLFMSFTIFKKLYSEKHQFYVPDNTGYLLENIERITGHHYTPTPQDIVQARASTLGVHEIAFDFKNFTIRLIDVGGQKSERRKWLHSFEGVTAVLFITSLCGFDQVLEEDPSINRLDDSLELFKNILNNQFLMKSNVILFMNKTDLFTKKLEFVQLHDYHPMYTGKNEFKPCSEYIEQLFLRDIPSEGRQVYSHFTNATDTENINVMFAAACDIILQNNLSQAGMQ
uniref:G protein alpha subunit n=1 Tax=Rhabditophanes sp. KR3021 TaxID=114890 RepID=A0AC35TVC0_9BILA